MSCLLSEFYGLKQLQEVGTSGAMNQMKFLVSMCWTFLDNLKQIGIDIKMTLNLNFCNNFNLDEKLWRKMSTGKIEKVVAAARTQNTVL